MRAADRRVAASAALGGLVGGFTTGDADTWIGNLLHVVVWGSTVALATWVVLETAATMLEDRRSR